MEPVTTLLAFLFFGFHRDRPARHCGQDDPNRAPGHGHAC